jgi:hypothetical protein
MKLIVCALLAGAVLHAEETVHWDDLAKIVNASKPNGSQEYTVVTRTGEAIRSRQLWVSPGGIRTPLNRMLRPDEVAEIQIRHRGRFNYFGWLGGKICPEPLSCVIPPTFLMILPIDWAFGAVATPPMSLIERTRRRKTPRILKIVTPQ